MFRNKVGEKKLREVHLGEKERSRLYLEEDVFTQQISHYNTSLLLSAGGGTDWQAEREGANHSGVCQVKEVLTGTMGWKKTSVIRAGWEEKAQRWQGRGGGGWEKSEGEGLRNVQKKMKRPFEAVGALAVFMARRCNWLTWLNTNNELFLWSITHRWIGWGRTFRVYISNDCFYPRRHDQRQSGSQAHTDG